MFLLWIDLTFLVLFDPWLIYHVCLEYPSLPCLTVLKPQATPPNSNNKALHISCQLASIFISVWLQKDSPPPHFPPQTCSWSFTSAEMSASSCQRISGALHAALQGHGLWSCSRSVCKHTHPRWLLCEEGGGGGGGWPQSNHAQVGTRMSSPSSQACMNKLHLGHSGRSSSREHAGSEALSPHVLEQPEWEVF